MDDSEPTNSDETRPDQLVSGDVSRPLVEGSSDNTRAESVPSFESSPDWSASVLMAKREWWQRRRRFLSKKRSRWIVTAVVLIAVIGLSILLSTSHSTPANQLVSTSQSSGGSRFSGGTSRFSGGGSNARSGPAAGGASGAVGAISSSGLTMLTSTDQSVTVDETSSTKYQKKSSSISASAITKGENVLVLGTVNSTTITATQVTIQPTSESGSSTKVVPFQKGAPTTSKQVGQIPANWSQGSGTIVSGTTAAKGTEVALAAYPGGIVDRVVLLSDGEYNVHIIGVNWPHHVFLSQDFKVVGAE